MLPKRLSNFALLIHKAVEKGVLLFGASILALLIANSHVADAYNDILHKEFSLVFGDSSFSLSLREWVNDFLMAIFFLMVGIEIKREIVEGHLSTVKQRVLPIIAAIGGIIVPVCIYSALNYNNAINLQAWATPAATDIAFAVGMLALFGKGLPTSLRVFLTALAIIDDLIAVLIIALFYTSQISFDYIVFIGICIIMLVFFNIFHVSSTLLYISVALIMWFFFLKSGVHATIAGVVLGCITPLRTNDGSVGPATALEKSFSGFVSYIVLPLFAFVNSGVYIQTLPSSFISNTIVLGVALGLFIGKQVGIFGTVYSFYKLGLVKLPAQSTLFQLYSVSVVCGIGFTMSLFIVLLSFDNYYTEQLSYAKLGVLAGSLCSVMYGAICLTVAKKN